MSVEIRKEQSGDIEIIRTVNDRAFERSEEGQVVDTLRTSCEKFLSLVAFIEGEIVGHILFTPVTIEQSSGTVEGMGLAPMAVLPECQNQGIGSKLVEVGLDIIKQADCPFVIVLGHENYYPRFGFQPASNYGLACQWDGVPEEAFMAMILDKIKMKDVSGVAKYRSEFDASM